MRILLTNFSLDHRAGSELYIRDLALALLAAGHEPIVYSPILGDVAAELRKETVVVTDDLAILKDPPDLIHAQHHLSAMTALTRFPTTPAIYLCHGWLPDAEAPPKHPRIYRYVAVDALVEKRLIDECGIPRKRVETFLNFVDLDRFHPRPTLPVEPRRVLVFSNYMSNADCLPAIREACEDRGLDLSTLGLSGGETSEHPENQLGHYDIVLAKGRSALEAIATGAAVIVCDRNGLGGMVTTTRYPEMRQLNFGVRLLRRRVTPQNLAIELARYDRDDASRCSELLRSEADLGRYLTRLTELYQTVIAEHRSSPANPEEEALATAHYLRWGPLQAGDLFHGERRRLHGEAAEVRAWAKGLDKEALRAQASIKDLETRLQAKEEERLRFLTASIESNRKTDEIRERLEVSLRHREEVEQQVESLELQLSGRAKQLADLEAEGASLAAHADRVDDLERHVTLLQQELSRVQQELSRANALLQRISTTRLWRWREKILGQRWIASLYRRLVLRSSTDRS